MANAKCNYRNLGKFALLGGVVLALTGSPAAKGDLVAFYDFEDDVNDELSGNANHGTATGTASHNATSIATAINGRSTKAFSFDGATHIELHHTGIDC